MEKKYIIRPKFIHNLWTTYESKKDFSYLTFIDNDYEVPIKKADEFLKFRGACTGHNSIDIISKRTGVDKNKIIEIVKEFDGIGMIRPNEIPMDTFSDEQVYNKFYAACNLWTEQLDDTSLFTLILEGKQTLQTFHGFLLETYHYIKIFPEIINSACKATEDQELKEILYKYYKQELGHEEFILRSLLELGFTRAEVETSVPLVSTQNILGLMKNLFTEYPFSVFLVARMIEAEGFDDKAAQNTNEKIAKIFDIPPHVLKTFFEHNKIDYELGHHKLLDDHKRFVHLNNKEDAHFILNAMHDIKHAFDLQKLEIINYYNILGNYIPRQKVDFFGV
ncbi:iron-containing redox enzyme family protein [Fluviispira vulneris]|uniref:iron-containing redox enzyme family protein n=1 Tax=Fluviispira vulneris TaxID=2763012 RepID=UPI00164410E7|nr:iron-containing redox enzyme family protein [Fluviispira vulneris]